MLDFRLAILDYRDKVLGNAPCDPYSLLPPAFSPLPSPLTVGRSQPWRCEDKNIASSTFVSAGLDRRSEVKELAIVKH